MNETLNKLLLIQKNVKETGQTNKVEEAFIKYLDNTLVNVVKYDLNTGIYALISALQAVEASKICGEEAAKFFLMRVFSASFIFHQFFLITINYLGMDSTFTVNIFKVLYEEKAK